MTKKNKFVVVLAEMAGYGGMSTQIAQISSVLKKDGYDICLLSVTTHPYNRQFRNRFPSIKMFIHHKIGSYHGWKNKISILYNTATSLREVAEKYEIDLFWSVGPLATIGFLLTPFGKTTRKIMQFLSPLDRELRMNFPQSTQFGTLIQGCIDALYFLAIKWSLHQFKTILSLSTTSNEMLIRHYQIPAERIYSTPGFLTSYIDKKRVTYNTMDLRKKLGLNHDRTIFLFPSRFEPLKNPEIIIQALQYTKNTNTTIVFSGLLQQDHFTKWQLWAIEHDVNKYLQFYPHREDSQSISQLYCASDCILFPSYNLETFGYVGLEALSLGIPVIGSGKSAVGEMIQKVDHRLVSDNTPKMYAKKLDWFNQLTPVEREKLRTKCISVSKEYNNKQTQDRLLTVVHSLEG